jgi:hypothetical protein
MALAFDVEFCPEDMGAPCFAQGFASCMRLGADAPLWSRPASCARDWFSSFAPGPARSAVDVSPETTRRENAAIAEAFVRIADIVGLAEAERAVLIGVANGSQG